MKKRIGSGIAILLAAVAFAVAVCGCGADGRLCDDVVERYLDLSSADGLAYVREHGYRQTRIPRDVQTFALEWRESGNAPYTVTLTDAARGTAERYVTEEGRLSPGTLVPSTVYAVNVTDAAGNVLREDEVTTESGVRIITARESAADAGVQNVRDLGGWQAGTKRVAYGKIYRGGRLASNLTPHGRDVLENRLHIRTEIDLRNSRDDGGQTVSSLSGCGYLKAPFTAYTAIYPNEAYGQNWFDPDTPGSMKAIFECLADASNYPVYFHCQIGQDRTGTLAYLINALLGVDYDDLTRDFELSAFSAVGNMTREGTFTYPDHEGSRLGSEEAAWERLHGFMISEYGENGRRSLSQAVGTYLTGVCGVTADTLDAVKKIMLTDDV